jgi:integrase/recombinase XerD
MRKLINRMNVLYWLRRNKINRRGTCTIYCRITVNSVRAGDFSTGIDISPSDWNSARQRAKNPIDQKKLNEITNKLDLIFLELQRENETVTAAEVKRRYFGESKKITLLQAYDLLITRKVEIHNAGELSKESIRVLNTRKKNLESFLKKIKRTEISPADFGPGLADQLQHYFKTVRGYEQMYVAKNIQTLKQVIRFACLHEYCKRNPLEYYSISFGKPKYQEILTEDEVEKIKRVNLTSEKLIKIRDLFLFQVYTGMAYVDMSRFTADMINEDDEGRQWITKDREKTGVEFDIPILPEAKLILEKYNNQLPIITNQKYNEYIKYVCDFAGIDKRVTTHVARRTCGSLLLNRGVSMKVISRFLGHKSTKITEQIYAHLKRYGMIKEVKRVGLVA